MRKLITSAFALLSACSSQSEQRSISDAKTYDVQEKQWILQQLPA